MIPFTWLAKAGNPSSWLRPRGRHSAARHRAPRRSRVARTPGLSLRDMATLDFFASLRAMTAPAPVPAVCVRDYFASVRDMALTGPLGRQTAILAVAALADTVGAELFTAQAHAAGTWIA